MKLTGLILFACLFAMCPVLIEMAKEFHDVGAAKLADYHWADWLILGTSAAALAATNLLSFFSNKWPQYQADKAAEVAARRTNPVANPAPQDHVPNA